MEDEEHERRIKRDLELERKRIERQRDYAKELQAIRDELDHEKRKRQYAAEEEDEKSDLAKKREELKTTKDSNSQYEQAKKLQKERAAAVAAKTASATLPTAKPKPSASSAASVSGVPDTASEEWEHLKQTEGAHNSPLDELMGMIGLETVKTEFLEIKNLVDTKVSWICMRFWTGMYGTNTRFRSDKVSTSVSSVLGPSCLETQARERQLWRGYMPTSLPPWAFSQGRTSKRPPVPSLPTLACPGVKS